jgi:hypothetical protein
VELMELQDEIQRMTESQNAKIKLRPTKLLMNVYPGETIEQFHLRVKHACDMIEKIGESK